MDPQDLGEHDKELVWERLYFHNGLIQIQYKLARCSHSTHAQHAANPLPVESEKNVQNSELSTPQIGGAPSPESKGWN